MIALSRNDLIVLELNQMVHASLYELAVAIVDARANVALCAQITEERDHLLAGVTVLSAWPDLPPAVAQFLSDLMNPERPA